MTLPLMVNGRACSVKSAPETPLLWVLRDELQLTGTKFGCGAAQCGACTVHLDGRSVRSCVLPVQAIGTQAVTTIESLAQQRVGRALQQAWIDHQVPQCGYCQSGFLMAAADLLTQNPRPSREQVDTALTNLCRCGTYPRMHAAIAQASANLFDQKGGQS